MSKKGSPVGSAEQERYGFAIPLTARCLGATTALGSVVMSGTEFGLRCCELSWITDNA